MKKRFLSLVVLFALLVSAASVSVGAENMSSEVTALRIAILEDPALHREGNAPYDASAIRALFQSRGHQADLLNMEEFATTDLMNRSAYDLVYLPSGAAFPAVCAANLKTFFAEGGKIITSGGFAFSDPIYPEDGGEEVHGSAAYVHSESKSTSPCLYKRLNANQFRDGGSYTLRIQIKSQNISTDSGLAHASVYIYGASDKLLSWRDFATYTSGSTDWTLKTYQFVVPGSAEYVDIRLGLYISSGDMAYDDLQIESADGKTVFSEDFENGINDWARMQAGSGTRFEVGEGVLQASDFCTYMQNDSTSGETGVAYDITKAVRKNADAEVSYEEKCGGIAPADGGINGAVIRLYSGETEKAEIPVCAASGTAGWHRRKASAHIGDVDFDRAELVFTLKGSSGVLWIDSPALTCGETKWTEADDPDPDYFGGAYKRGRDKEAMLLGSVEPISAGDQLFYGPDEIPIFDIETVFAGGVRVAGAEGQAVFPNGETVLTGSDISGFSAVTVTGHNRGRWQPLLEVYDTLGQKVGTAAAIFTVFNTPSDYGALGSIQTWNGYSGTSIAFFGVTSQDLFAEGNDALRDGLVKLAEHLCSDAKLCCVTNSYDCYRKGETPKMTIGVENHSKETQSVTVVTDIVSEDTGETVYTSSSDGKIVPGKRKYFRTTWADASLEDDFYEVRVRVEQNGRTVDRFETGFVVWKDDVVRNGPKYRYHDNYIHLVQEDGTEKAVYANGVDEGGPFIMEDQTPLIWRRDFQGRADAGILIYETLQQYRGYGDYSAVFATAGSFEVHMRKVDAAVYLSQRYGQIYMMGMLLGQNSAVGDAQLEEDKEFIRTMAARYKDVPGVIFYLNGDLILKMSSDTDPLFRDYLKERYGTDEAFQNAWNTAKTIDEMSFDTAYAFNGTGWTDTKAYDQNVFRTKLLNRWTTELTKVAKEAGGEEKAVVCEFYAWPSEGADVPYGIGGLTYSNTGFFDKLPIFSQTLAYADQRWQGKSMGIGETNKRTHPLFTDTLDYYQSDSYTHARAYFFTTYYTTLAMGGNHHQTWCWKDETKYVFPWGLNTVYESVPKDSFYWLRNSNLVTSGIEPVYTTPSVAIVTPDSTRMAGSRGWYLGHYNAVDAIHILQGTLCDRILTLNECNFDIPEGVKVLLYPSAYTVPDDVYEKLLSFVRNGGVLYLSGDPSYDPVSRKRTLESRLKELTGVSSEQVVYPGNDQAGAALTYTDGTHTRSGYPNVRVRLDGAEAVYSAEDGTPVITRYRLGSGTVFYSSDPFENNTTADSFRDDVEIYRLALAAANVETAPLTASTASIKTFVTDLKDGGTFRQVLNTSAADVRLEYRAANGQTIEFRLGAYMSAFFREDADGKLTSSMVGGNLSADGERVLTNSAIAQTVSLDGKDLAESSRMLILPTTKGSFRWKTSADGSLLRVVSCQVFGNTITEGTPVPFQYDASTGFMSFDVEDSLKNRIYLVTGSGAEDLTAARQAVCGLLNASVRLSEPEPEPETPSDPSIPIAIGAGAGIIVLTGLTTVLVMKKKNYGSSGKPEEGDKPEDKTEPSEGPEGEEGERPEKQDDELTN
ncbi:MAG: beta-galactosidase trimerization domain-containing protein [Clostridia bacterium]|nr:beta-galactosidase trimerization domain-containing protein [Clostridia bacterium]